MVRLGLLAVMVAGCGRIGFAPVGGGDGGPGSGDDSGITLNGDAISAIASNLVFVTSTSAAPGSYGGLAGADAMCQERAMAVGLPGSYVAYLSTLTVNAVDRLGSARGWSRLDGRPVFDTVADIKAYSMFYPPLFDDLGRVVTVNVATGTTQTAVGNGWDCTGWTSTTSLQICGGFPHGTNWSLSFFDSSCQTTHPVYCFGVDRNVPTAPPAIPSRRAFLTQGSWMSGGGITSADAFCQGEANAASLPGTYLALLATSTATAISRFDLTGPPWVRLDNTELALSNAAFATSDTIAPLDTTTALTHTVGLVMTGATSPDVVGTTALTCGDWTISNPSKSWYDGYSGLIGSAFFDYGGGGVGCNNPGPLYCLQQ
jgi:hypothetical protein